ncbi:MAG: 3-hydroxyacyl-CoA dehydrogenase NAD-binding domain-containing protein [Syntrophales bacterium]|nr:3-hydroxyacyl-CoA dehydrogenase NAD-binding domain-containing protein [Syntrophales bacterium]MDD5532874.1 3-hydroxyacyl-CoA dehydrogenase NAD-binding domain-containing protein [Syntrophales bacterium]
MSKSGIFNLRMEDRIAVVTFDVPGEAMNTWTEEAVLSYRAVLEELEGTEGALGVVFISGKPDNFFAGANLKLLQKMEDAQNVRQALDIFHDSFNRLAHLPFPSVAAINGACAGGGLEFSLACTARIAKDTKSTVIGLPECKVGLFPGAGGSQRLPRLIGYPAIELILKGELVPAAKALKLGMIDRLVPADRDLLEEAKALVRETAAGTAGLKRPVQDFSMLDMAAEMARQGVLKFTRGREIPGPLLAIRAMQEGLRLPLEKGLEIEKNYFTETVLSREAKGSIHTFFLKTMMDRPRGMMTRGFAPKQIRKAAVLGFGTMGRGIAIDIVRNMKIPVLVKDFPETHGSGRDFVRKTLQGMADKGKLKGEVEEILGLLTAVSDFSDSFADADLVIEAVFEDVKVKSDTYRELCKVVPDDCLIASNTSSIPLSAMAGFVTRPERFGGTHFFSPVWLMQLVEVVRGEKTSQETVDNLINFAASIRKRPIVCRDNPGFVVNALLFPYLLGALDYLEKGNSIEKIDGALVRFGMPLGPIRLTDEVGIDVPHKIFAGMGIRQETLKNLVDAGRLGLKKSGRGFFLKDGAVDPEVLPLISLKDPRQSDESEIQDGLLTAMVRVGADLLDRKVVEDPRMIDVGMIWGTGFPPEKGGPMKWADLTGLSKKLFGKNFYI